MARDGELPRALDAVHPTYGVPHRAELAAGGIVCLLVVLTDVRGAIGFSSFGVLLYYAVANASAWTLTAPRPAATRALAALGLLGCLVLAFSLPTSSVVGGLVVVAAGLAGRSLANARR